MKTGKISVTVNFATNPFLDVSAHVTSRAIDIVCDARQIDEAGNVNARMPDGRWYTLAPGQFKWIS